MLLQGPTETKFKHKHDKPIDTNGPPNMSILSDMFKTAHFQRNA